VRSGSAGSGPTGKRANPSIDRRSRAPRPRTAPSRDEVVATRRRQTTLTARAAILVVALAAVALAVALPFKIWLGQRSDIASLNTQTQQAQHQISALQAERKRWNSPSYIEQQARERLHYVMPGQKTYVVLGAPATPKKKSLRDAAATSTAPWYSQLWASVASSGAAPTHP
jgi:cell division protein FtsB